MHRIIYDTSTGKIVDCREIGDQMWAIYQQLNTGVDFIPGYVVGERLHRGRVNLQTLELEVDPAPIVTHEADIRYMRNQLLTASDWTQGADSPLSESARAEWAAYRTALRDLSDTYDLATVDKNDIVWPQPPGA